MRRAGIGVFAAIHAGLAMDLAAAFQHRTGACATASTTTAITGSATR